MAILDLTLAPVVSPAFGGMEFGTVGQYEVMKGTAKGVLDPSNPLNAGIVNLDRAPRNSSGLVEYIVDVAILKPVDMSRGNRRIFYEVVNRGTKFANFWINSGVMGNDPWGPGDVGTGFLMNQGYTIVWSAWQGDVVAGGGRMLAQFPIPTNNGQPIVGTSREEYTDTGISTTFTGNLTYPAADLDPTKATLTVRAREHDPRAIPSDLTWQYLNTMQISINRPAGYDSGAIYEFIYPAKDPKVMGIGFAAVRDVVSYLRYEKADDNGTPNPLKLKGKPSIKKVLALGVSQSGRFLRDFIHQGFNEDESGRITFDGVIPLITGSRKSFTNYEFAQPGRNSRQHEDHLFPGDQFPFTYRVTTDPISGETGGIHETCQCNDTCPKIMHMDGENEIWQGRGSLVVTNTRGTKDLTLPKNVRAYLFAGTQHFPGLPPTMGICQQLSNPMDYRPFIRALIVALDRWVSDGTQPPPSQYASLKSGTLVPPLSTGFPDIPGVNYTGLVNYLNVLDHSTQPPTIGAPYPEYVTAVDADGNSIAGIRHPFLIVPLGTYTGWNLRAIGHGANDLCSLTGSYIPFAKTAEERIAAGDPRLSIEERYRNHNAYLIRVVFATLLLYLQGFLLVEDAAQIIQDAATGDMTQDHLGVQIDPEIAQIIKEHS
ncbi:hypothetical protein JOC95_001807 [Bacillus tianshenii]|uniref:Alpha/beta hydrolase domain-containing protein n=1 Tax=Sutcliffiella tianshenii TaxID=1463404 RepID=A0ABS2P0J6_9BACI|nr:alpha/beta hydrolase domain-containing protein [Bacillus tianshenii]MBM7619955.1 hypothetical protein [Bacillus tianshenii]